MRCWGKSRGFWESLICCEREPQEGCIPSSCPGWPCIWIGCAQLWPPSNDQEGQHPADSANTSGCQDGRMHRTWALVMYSICGPFCARDLPSPCVLVKWDNTFSWVRWLELSFFLPRAESKLIHYIFGKILLQTSNLFKTPLWRLLQWYALNSWCFYLRENVCVSACVCEGSRNVGQGGTSWLTEAERRKGSTQGVQSAHSSRKKAEGEGRTIFTKCVLHARQ